MRRNQKESKSNSCEPKGVRSHKVEIYGDMDRTNIWTYGS